jgi:putative ABC transport system permease protein
MHNQGITVFSIPVLKLVIMVVLAGLAGVVAAIPPSRRAAKLNILRAIVSE